ncbi:hypothetical protein GH722_04880 [Alphaproteobacteria bacterium HT1-32]|nr:hypothetical protein [Alphaproteobacteria bacterium HT1-32]
MSSSRSQSVIPAEVAIGGFMPWQVARMKDRLANYKHAVKHSWSRISIDILDEDGQDPDYVDDENVDALAESLRRLVAGSQQPKDERLKAIFIYLVTAGYMDPADLSDSRNDIKASLAFMEFMFDDDEHAERALAHMEKYVGAYSKVEQSGLAMTPGEFLTHSCIFLSQQGRALAAKYTETVLKRTDSAKRLTTDPQLRKRALVKEMAYDGFALFEPGGRVIIYSRPAAYSELYDAKVQLLWARPGNPLEPVEESEISSILVMDYNSVSYVEDFDEAKAILNNESDTTLLMLDKPQFAVFERD